MASIERPKAIIMTKDSVSLLPCFYFVELPILVSLVASLYFLELTDMFKPVHSGYSCHDRSLSLPYIEPTHEVVPLLMLLSLAFAGPAITIMVGEGILFCCRSWRKCGVGAEADLNAAGCSFNSFIRRVVRFVGVHVFGLCATAIVTDIIQLATGYHAPYFLTVCKPNYTTLNATCEHSPYILDDICSGADPALITQGRKSFPSQHATLASFAAVYVSMYFNSTLTDSSRLLKPLLVFSFSLGAVICGLTRIVQHKNHPIDVYLGFLLGGVIAAYLGLYAVGSFQPSERTSPAPPPLPHPALRPACHLPHISQEAGRHHLHHRGGGHNTAACRPGTDSEAASPRIPPPPGREGMVTFSHTLPRAHTPATLEDAAAARRSATLHHASLDVSRSKQLLTQWKSKNDSRKFSLQTPPPPDSCSSSEVGGQGPSLLPPHPQLRPGSDPSSMGLGGVMNGAGVNHLCPHPYLAAGSSTTLPNNCSSLSRGGGGGGGGGWLSVQARPSSSQLVHIPEEGHGGGDASARPGGGGVGAPGEGAANGCAQANWAKAAEKYGGALCRTSEGGGGQAQPRIMQVITMSKQQGLLHSKSLDEGSCSGSCQAGPGLGRYRAFTDQDAPSPPPGALGSVGSISGSTGAIVRVEAHPGNDSRPLVPPPSADGSGSWRWRLQVGGGVGGGRGGGGGGGGGAVGVCQPSELNDLNRDGSESSESARDATLDRKRMAVHNPPYGANNSTVATVTTQHPGDPRLQPQPLTTIRVTPVESGGGTEAPSEAGAPSAASSRDSTLRRKGNSMILIPERGDSPDATRNIFYRGTSSTPAFRE